MTMGKSLIPGAGVRNPAAAAAAAARFLSPCKSLSQTTIETHPISYSHLKPLPAELASRSLPHQPPWCPFHPHPLSRPSHRPEPPWMIPPAPTYCTHIAHHLQRRQHSIALLSSRVQTPVSTLCSVSTKPALPLQPVPSHLNWTTTTTTPSSRLSHAAHMQPKASETGSRDSRQRNGQTSVDSALLHPASPHSAVDDHRSIIDWTSHNDDQGGDGFNQ